LSHPRRPRQTGARPPRRSAGATHIAWIPSAVGLLVSLYLLGLDLLGTPVFCVAQHGCDTVRSSAYGRIVGIPVAAIGVVFFAVGLGLSLSRTSWRDRWLALLAAVGVGASIVFLGLQFGVLHAVCPYCLIAEAAAFALAYLVLRPTSGAERIRVAGLALVTAVALSAIYAWTPRPASTDYAAGLARHLSQDGDVFYGAYWCPHCQEQKALFGSAASLLPYVECDPRGARAQPDRCRARGIRVYPTWEIRGHLVEGTLTLEELARRSGYKAPEPGR
jgi:uncharacterized membrane protein